MNSIETITARPLPRSLGSLDGESLIGYLLRLAHRLDMSPGELAQRTGLARVPAVIGTKLAVQLPDDAIAAFADATGLTPDEVTRMTMTRWDGHLFDSKAPARAAKSITGALWVTHVQTRYCPQCLATANTHPHEHAAWRTTWQTPWALACVEHGRMMADSCPTCGTAAGRNAGNRFRSLIPQSGEPVDDPTACRAAVEGGMCGHNFAEAETITAPKAVLQLQGRLDKILRSTTDTCTSLGVPVADAQYLRDLRLVAVLLQLANLPRALTALRASMLADTRDYLNQRAYRRFGADTLRQSGDRTWTQAPRKVTVSASLLVTAADLLSAPEPAALPDLIAAATRNEYSLWSHIRSKGEPSGALASYFARSRYGLSTVKGLRTATAQRTYTIQADHVPAYLPQRDYDRHFPHAPRGAERPIRRAVSLALVRLVTGDTLAAAAETLGYTPVEAQTAIGRTARNLGDLRGQPFYRLISRIAADLDADTRIDYGHRRRNFPTNWLIPTQAWEELKHELITSGLARDTAFWDRRRPAYAAWIWARVTGGDTRVAPMIATKSTNGRRTTGGVAQILSGIRSRPEHWTIVDRYATATACIIDKLPSAT